MNAAHRAGMASPGRSRQNGAMTGMIARLRIRSGNLAAGRSARRGQPQDAPRRHPGRDGLAGLPPLGVRSRRTEYGLPDPDWPDVTLAAARNVKLGTLIERRGYDQFLLRLLRFARGSRRRKRRFRLEASVAIGRVECALDDGVQEAVGFEPETPKVEGAGAGLDRRTADRSRPALNQFFVRRNRLQCRKHVPAGPRRSGQLRFRAFQGRRRAGWQGRRSLRRSAARCPNGCRAPCDCRDRA